MNVQQFYDATGGNYEDTLRRLCDEARIIKFLSKFIEDQSFTQLRDAMKKGDCESAFRAAHSLKGICMNLGLTQLQESSSALTENLRGTKVEDKTAFLFEKVTQDYGETCTILRELLNS